MKPAPFEYFAPAEIEEALELLGRGGDVSFSPAARASCPP